MRIDLVLEQGVRDVKRHRHGAVGFVALLALTCVSCRGASVVSFPHRLAPDGYPAVRSEDLPGSFVIIPGADFARALAGRRYRARYGTMVLPGPDDAVDARTGSWGFPAQVPFERELTVSPADVHVSVFASSGAGRAAPGTVHRQPLRLVKRESGLHANGACVLDGMRDVRAAR